ncbi:MAG: HU family DNA-binding protein [Salinivirgaceae bacterium]
MPIKYKIASTNKPGQGKAGEKVYFPRLTESSRVSMDYLIPIIEKRSSASGADVYSVLYNLVNLIPEMLLDGKTIKLENLGTFSLHAQTRAESSPEEVNAQNITGLKVVFRPDVRIKQELKHPEFIKV